MRTQNRPFRMIATLAVAGLLIVQILPQQALAQATPPPPQTGEQQRGADPPARVGRLARLSGAVSFHPADDTQWSPATLNYPVTQGDAFWTEPNARAAIEVSGSRLTMAPGTELDVATLSDNAFQATVPQGELYLNVRAAPPGETYVVQTPRGMMTFAAPGRYGVVAGDTQTPTTVTVVEGSARVEGPGDSLDVGANQTASITGTDTFQGEVGPAQRDAFLTAMLDSERPAPSQGAVPPTTVAAMPGGSDLAEYGTWTNSPDYGQVWYPQVAPDWVPYREGSWAYVEPWGWTWVDSEPWGFAPFHYGRWVDIGGRWAWVPGGAPSAPAPVYAPALVTFLGVGAVVGVGIGAALAAGRIGWCPLGPREAYHPWYRASDRYFRQVNGTHVTNFTTINRNVAFNNFVNRGAATVVPTSAMTASRPVARSFQPLVPAQLAQVRPVIGAQPLRPTTATAGVTPAVARQLGMPAPPAGLRPAAPGPAFRGTPANAAARPPLPILHNPASPGAVPAAAGTHPFTATPALRSPPAPGQVGPPAIRHEPTAAAPGAIPRMPPGVTQGGGPAPGTLTHISPFEHGQPPAGMPQATPPAALRVAPPAAPHTAPAMTAPPPVVSPHPGPFGHGQPPAGMPQATPPAALHVAPPAVTHIAPAVTAAPPVVHTPPPVVHAPAPPPVAPPAAMHVAPAPTPQFHAPPPVVHNAPVQQNDRKRPGEP